METTEKLTIHHLAKRLPYGLKYKPNIESDILSDIYADMGNPMGLYQEALEHGCEKAKELNGSFLEMDLQMIIPDDGSYLLGNGNLLGYPVDDVYLSEVKPVLFPLSSLTKEVTIKGKTFVPLIRVAEICFENNPYEKDWSVAGNYVCSSAGITFGFDADMSLYISDKDYYEGRVKSVLFEKLLELHFDTDNLIEKGLAISVHDLKENPYE